jgi:hypothetical protein
MKCTYCTMRCTCGGRRKRVSQTKAGEIGMLCAKCKTVCYHYHVGGRGRARP